MSKVNRIAEVDELLGRFLDGAALAPQDSARLDTLLLENPDLLDQFVITTALASDLRYVASLAVSADGESQAKVADRSAQWLLKRGLGVSLLALAASAFFVAWPLARMLRGDVESSPPADSPPEFVATVVSQDGWAQGIKYPSGSRVPTGALELQSGVVQLQFDSGPNLLVEGPASLEIRGVSQAHLTFGKLVFRDDSGCDSFQLSTPWSEFTDLGTEYAVSLSGDDEEVHVFSGSVERTGVTEGGHTPVELLKNGQAIRYKRSVATPTESISTEPKKFIRRVHHDREPTDQQHAAYESFDYSSDSAIMRGRANGGFGWAGAWRRNSRELPGHNDRDLALRVGDSLVFGSKTDASVGGSLGYVGNWLAHRNLAVPIDLAANRVIYVSFLYRPAGQWRNGENSLKVFFYSPGEGDIEHRIAIALDPARGLVRGALCGALRQCPLPLADGSTYLVVTKIACSADNPDQLMLRVFQPEEPVSLREPANWTVVTPAVDSDDSFQLISLIFNCKHEQRIDEFRIGETWSSVTSPWSTKGELAHLERNAPASE